MNKNIKLLSIAILIFLLVACGSNNNKETSKGTQKEVSLQTIQETETKEKEEFAKFELEARLENYDINKSSKIIAKITDIKEKIDTFSIMDIKVGKEKDQFILSKDLLMNKEYEISLIPSINKDGSINEIKNDFRINTSSNKFTEKIKSKYIAKEEVTKEQLEDIIKKTTVAVENGDESLVKENGKKALAVVNKNIQNSPIAKKEKIKPIVVTVNETSKEEVIERKKEVAQETVKETVKETTKPVIKETVKETVRETTKPVVKETPKETVRETQAEKPKTKVWVVDVPAQDPVYENKYVVDVKFQPAVYENKCTVTKEAWTETTDELIDFDQIVKDRWFVKEAKSGKITYFYSSAEASDYHVALGNKGIVSNWGTAEPEVEIVNKKYKTIEHPAENSCKDVLVKEAVQEKGHYEKILVKEAVKEQGHWEYR